MREGHNESLPPCASAKFLAGLGRSKHIQLGVCTTPKKIVFYYENGLGLRPVETTTYRGRKTAEARACIPPLPKMRQEYLLTFTDGFGTGHVAVDLRLGFARHFGCGCGERFWATRPTLWNSGASCATITVAFIVIAFQSIVPCRLRVQCLPNFFPTRGVVGALNFEPVFGRASVVLIPLAKGPLLRNVRRHSGIARIRHRPSVPPPPCRHPLSAALAWPAA